ncbi:hypothetical protein CDEST_15581 [Colletotrichum destructivum]|uniref:Rhodopsin domain-containing protein n=1 Tax=Colletotrichum destructivum TaxID=34406 RepID=A0AAX4J5E8_9PEZI|nr:hypothetical protein CDEST_15581 [Colletotrichum destructivum]
MRIQRMKKLGIILMFSIGFFLTAVSAYRIKAVLAFSTSYNASADSLQTSVWSHIEVIVGVVVACLPSIRQLWRKISPYILQVVYNPKPSKSPQDSKSTSQNSRAPSKPHAIQQPMVYDESSIAHLVGDLNRIDLNALRPTEADSPKSTKTNAKTKGTSLC